MEASEEKREQYQKLIEDIGPERLVYIDESGIDMTICKEREAVARKVKNCLAKKVENIMSELILLRV